MVSPILRYLFALLEPATARALFSLFWPCRQCVARGADALSSQIDNDIADRTRTADEEIAGRWQIEGLRLVYDLS
jgi:hypothetical protein